MGKSAITYDVLSELISNYVENNIVYGDVKSGENIQLHLECFINLCSDLQYYVREKTGADF